MPPRRSGLAHFTAIAVPPLELVSLAARIGRGGDGRFHPSRAACAGRIHAYRARTADARGGTRKTLIVALARKLLIALWRMVTTGEVPAGVVLRPA